MICKDIPCEHLNFFDEEKTSDSMQVGVNTHQFSTT